MILIKIILNNLEQLLLARDISSLGYAESILYLAVFNELLFLNGSSFVNIFHVFMLLLQIWSKLAGGKNKSKDGHDEHSSAATRDSLDGGSETRKSGGVSLKSFKGLYIFWTVMLLTNMLSFCAQWGSFTFRNGCVQVTLCIYCGELKKCLELIFEQFIVVCFY